MANLSDFGLLGEQSASKSKIPGPERPWTTVQNLTPLALSLADKIHNCTNTQKQTNKETNK